MKEKRNKAFYGFFNIFIIFFSAFLIYSLAVAESAEALLKPEEIVVIVNQESADSIRLGALYAGLRRVPRHHIVKISATTKEYVSRENYDTQIAKPVRNALNVLFRNGSIIRCLVTTYGMPLRVGAVKQLILPEEMISRYKRIKKVKHEKRKKLLKQKEASNENNNNLNKEISRLKKEIDNIGLTLQKLTGYDTVAAVDSELALLLMPDYTFSGWQPNPEYLYNRRNIKYFGQLLMVSRLDAPSPALAEGLVRTAIEVEAEGIEGKIYLDARGLRDKGPYGIFDEDIRRAAGLLRNSTMEVVLDNRPGLFRQGDAPSAALYCGWYSLGKYIDAFTWSKGAVGYHIASSEAVSIRNPNSRYWVKSMIEKGVVATLGPVAEPYLQAFPQPSIFFPILMSGRYTLAEVFAMTNPFLSWRMVLIGDPLYNPFKNKPAYTLKTLPDIMMREKM